MLGLTLNHVSKRGPCTTNDGFYWESRRLLLSWSCTHLTVYLQRHAWIIFKLLDVVFRGNNRRSVSLHKNNAKNVAMVMLFHHCVYIAGFMVNHSSVITDKITCNKWRSCLLITQQKKYIANLDYVLLFQRCSHAYQIPMFGPLMTQRGVLWCHNSISPCHHVSSRVYTSFSYTYIE